MVRPSAPSRVYQVTGRDGKTYPAKKAKPKLKLVHPPKGDDESFLDDEGNFAPLDPEVDEARRIRGFLYRAQEAVHGAEMDDLKGLTVTAEMAEAARNAMASWTMIVRSINETIINHKEFPNDCNH
jgi:hypothetical protein